MTEVLDNPETIYQFAHEKAPLLRQQMVKGLMQGTFDRTGHIVLSEAIYVTYNGISLCSRSENFLKLCEQYLAEHIQLAWNLIFHVRTPGKNFPQLPEAEGIFIPTTVLENITTHLIMRPVQQ